MINSDWLIFGECDEPNYLYVANECSQPIFHRIQEEMSQLNDFCLLSLESTYEHVQKLKSYSSKLRSGEDIAFDEAMGDISDDVAWGIEEFQLPIWMDTQQFISRAMCLVLLSALLEKSLKDLVKFFSHNQTVKFKKTKGTGEVESLLIHLNDEFGINFNEPEQSIEARELCRKIRNDFAHGHWDKVKESIRNYRLVSAFAAVAALLTAIDKATEMK